MSNTIHLDILTPDRKFYSGDVVSVNTESEVGRIEILPDHTPIVTSLNPTVTSFLDTEGKQYKAFTSSGVLRVHEDKVIILCDTAEWPEEIDLERAEAAKKNIEEQIQKKDGESSKRMELKLRRSIMRIKTKE